WRVVGHGAATGITARRQRGNLRVALGDRGEFVWRGLWRGVWRVGRHTFGRARIAPWRRGGLCKGGRLIVPFFGLGSVPLGGVLEVGGEVAAHRFGAVAKTGRANAVGLQEASEVVGLQRLAPVAKLLPRAVVK